MSDKKETLELKKYDKILDFKFQLSKNPTSPKTFKPTLPETSVVALEPETEPKRLFTFKDIEHELAPVYANSAGTELQAHLETGDVLMDIRDLRNAAFVTTSKIFPSMVLRSMVFPAADARLLEVYWTILEPKKAPGLCFKGHTDVGVLTTTVPFENFKGFLVSTGDGGKDLDTVIKYCEDDSNRNFLKLFKSIPEVSVYKNHKSHVHLGAATVLSTNFYEVERPDEIEALMMSLQKSKPAGLVVKYANKLS